MTPLPDAGATRFVRASTVAASSTAIADRSEWFGIKSAGEVAVRMHGRDPPQRPPRNGCFGFLSWADVTRALTRPACPVLGADGM